MRRAARTDAKSKYGNRRTGVYASKKEAKRAAELKLLERAGKIRNLREQVKFVLIPKQVGERECFYVADFVYDLKAESSNDGVRLWANGVVEDCKGVRTRVYRIKRKLMLHVHKIRILET